MPNQDLFQALSSIKRSGTSWISSPHKPTDARFTMLDTETSLKEIVPWFRF